MIKNKLRYYGSQIVDDYTDYLKNFTLEQIEALTAEQIKSSINRTKLPSLTIPREYGGLGFKLEDALHVLHDVAYMAPSAALMLCMHYHVVSTIAKFPDSFSFSSEILNNISTKNLLVASAFAESGASQNIFQTSVSAKVCGDSVVVDGSKRPCTMSSIADFIAVSIATEEQLPGIAIVSRDTKGLSSRPFWPGDIVLGTDSNEVIFDNVKLDSEWVTFARDASFENYLRYGLVCFNLLIGAAYSGVTKAIVDKLKDNVLRKSSEGVEIKGKLAQCFYSLVGISSAFKLEDLDHFVPEVLSMRYQIQKMLKEIKNQATDNIGSRIYLSDIGLNYLLRVVDLMPFHPVTRSGFDLLIE